MSEQFDILQDILSSEHGIELSLFPGREQVTAPGFYWNPQQASVEHWSVPCAYTAAMVNNHFMNSQGLLQDGWQSILGSEDLSHFTQTIKNWSDYLKANGVI